MAGINTPTPYVFPGMYNRRIPQPVDLYASYGSCPVRTWRGLVPAAEAMLFLATARQHLTQ